MNDSFLPVKVMIDDPRKFAHVVTLLDRDDFLTDVYYLRKSWNLIKPLSKNEYKDWDSFPGIRYAYDNKIELSQYKNERHKQLWDKYKSVIPEGVIPQGGLEKLMWNLSDLEDMGIEARDELTELYKFELVTNLFEYFRFQVIGLREKYKRPPNFDRIIGNAILFNEVANEDYVTCEIGIESPNVESLPYFDDPRMVITFYPLVSEDDIRKIFLEKGEELIEQYERGFLGGHIINFDTMGNIKRDREWYWLKTCQKLSWSELHREISTNSKEVITQDGVIKAVKTYAKRLQVEI